MIVHASAEFGPSRGIAGWLLLPCISVILTPFYLAYSSYLAVKALVSLTNTVSDDVKTFVALEAVANCGLLLLSIVTLVAMVKLKNTFPMLFIYLNVGILFFFIIDVTIGWWGYNVPATDADIKSIGRLVVGCVIWIPYMLLSRRVRDTFQWDNWAKSGPIPVTPTRTITDERLPPLAPEESQETARYKRKGHRLGILVTVISVLFLIVGMLNSGSYPVKSWADPLAIVGFLGALAGYILSRLFFWFRAA